MLDETPLRDRVVLLTGAAGGIGSELARRFAELGARLALVDTTAVDREHWKLPEDRALPLQADVADFAEASRVVEACETEWGRIDVLVNNAAIVDNITRTDRMDPAAWDRDIAVNLSAAFYLTKLVLPGMVQRRWGRIVNMSSVAANGFSKQAGYSASKAGLLGLTGTVASEFSEVGVTCNAVQPGLIGTPRVRGAPEDILEAARAVIPAGRLGEVEEVVAVVTFLTLPVASYVTGAAIPVDGGTRLPAMRFSRPSHFADAMPGSP